CSACPRIGYVGVTTGPILSQIGRTRSRRDLIEAIAFPSARLEQSYRSTKIQTSDGEVLNGLIVEESASSIALQVAADRRVTVQRNDIEAMEPSSVSIMPAGLEQQLTRQELADLIAFLENAK
ncbi:MAG: dehydrogenase, partial [Planctomycetota bacterium]